MRLRREVRRRSRKCPAAVVGCVSAWGVVVSWLAPVSVHVFQARDASHSTTVHLCLDTAVASSIRPTFSTHHSPSTARGFPVPIHPPARQLPPKHLATPSLVPLLALAAVLGEVSRVVVRQSSAMHNEQATGQQQAERMKCTEPMVDSDCDTGKRARHQQPDDDTAVIPTACPSISAYTTSAISTTDTQQFQTVTDIPAASPLTLAAVVLHNTDIFSLVASALHAGDCSEDSSGSLVQLVGCCRRTGIPC